MCCNTQLRQNGLDKAEELQFNASIASPPYLAPPVELQRRQPSLFAAQPGSDPNANFPPVQSLYHSGDKATAEADWYQASSSGSRNAGVVQSTPPHRTNLEYPEGGKGSEGTQQYGGRKQAGSDGTQMQYPNNRTLQQGASKATHRDGTSNQGGKPEVQQATIAEVRSVGVIRVL